jgi:arylformamidase
VIGNTMDRSALGIPDHIPDKRALEREYSPSSRVTDLQALLSEYAARSVAARERRGHEEFRYGASEAEVFDFFPALDLHRARTPGPVVVYIHGGYWQELSKNEHSFPAVALNALGVSYVAINYGLAPEVTLDEMIDRCRRAIAYIGNRSLALHFDPAAIHLVGSSAGAHLAAMTALTDWPQYGLATPPLQTLTLLSGIYDLRPLLLTYISDAMRMSRDDASRNSPALLLAAAPIGFPPTLVAWGEYETAEFKRQSREFTISIRRNGGLAREEEIGGRNHFDLIFDIGEPATRLGALMLGHFGCARL